MTEIEATELTTRVNELIDRPSTGPIVFHVDDGPFEHELQHVEWQQFSPGEFAFIADVVVEEGSLKIETKLVLSEETMQSIIYTTE